MQTVYTTIEMIIVPKSNELRWQLYSTLVDIGKYGPICNFENFVGPICNLCRFEGPILSFCKFIGINLKILENLGTNLQKI